MHKRGLRVVGGTLVSLALIGFAQIASAQEAGGSLGVRVQGPLGLGVDVDADTYASSRQRGGYYVPDAYQDYDRSYQDDDRPYAGRPRERQPLVGGIVDSALGLAGATTGAALDTAGVASHGALGLADGIVDSLLGSR
ncbi:hypothetical protein D3874_14085 [Oleomonas cavernae]|uniref:Secreted protein n=1 Tax=Oleomonas cavernae TaxID=2320859 RepID=A0A418WDA7_9PROT|nr:hypothetical protein [Oleomonas cavernae]RJF88012.1 hypothetical protein D3874_14085 [Oleomonas cavernae]